MNSWIHLGDADDDDDDGDDDDGDERRRQTASSSSGREPKTCGNIMSNHRKTKCFCKTNMPRRINLGP